VLAEYHLLPAARADLLARLGRHAEAAAAFVAASELTDNVREATLLRARGDEAQTAQGAAPVFEIGS